MEQNLVTIQNKFTSNHIALTVHILPVFLKKLDKKFAGFIDAVKTVF